MSSLWQVSRLHSTEQIHAVLIVAIRNAGAKGSKRTFESDPAIQKVLPAKWLRQSAKDVDRHGKSADASEVESVVQFQDDGDLNYQWNGGRT